MIHPQRKNFHLLSALAIAAACLTPFENAHAVDEGAVVFANAQRAVVRILVKISPRQLEAERSQMLEQAVAEARRLEEWKEQFSKNAGSPPLAEAGDPVPIGEEDQRLKSELQKSFQQIAEDWQARWQKKIKALELQGTKPRHVGMGVIIDPSGIVLTCCNVVRSSTNPEPFTVVDYAGRQFDAVIHAADALTNIALLKIPPEACTDYIQVPSEDVRPLRGSDVFAIQSAYGLDPSPFRGIVCNFDIMLGNVLLERYIQLQMEMFPGNFGAPVFASDGNLLGMLVGDYPPASGPKITCAIPQKMLSDVVPDLIVHGYKPRGSIGIDLDPHQMLTISGVEPGSAADRAGLLAGDVLMAFDGRNLESYMDLTEIVDRTRPGQHVTVIVKRGHHVHQLEMILGADGAPPATHGFEIDGAAPVPTPPAQNAGGSQGRNPTPISATPPPIPSITEAAMPGFASDTPRQQ